jgi:sensor c-di-GMP phosphodiesterase-like protein
MSLRRVAGAEALAQWEAAGGRLFVPGVVRPAIDQAGRK